MKIFTATLNCALACLLATASSDGNADPMVLAYYSGYANNYAALVKFYANFNAASLDYYNISGTGVVSGNGDAAPSNAIAFLRSKKIPAYGCVSNVDPKTGGWSASVAHGAMYTHGAAAVANLVAFATANKFAGINIDFEEVNQGDRNNFNYFAQSLAKALHAKGMKLIISVPAFSAADAGNIYNYGYDLHALGAVADYLQIMTYDEAIPTWDPGAVAGSDWVENDLDYTTSLVPPAKILNGLPAYGYDWLADNSGSQLYWGNTPALIKKYGIAPAYDVNSNSVHFTYTASDGSGRHTVWTENARSITLKAGLVNSYGLGGTSVYALGMEDANFWSAVKTGLAR